MGQGEGGALGGTHFTYLLQGGHPGDRQVAVLQEDPGSLLLSSLNHANGNGPLALSKRQGVQLGATKPLTPEGEQHMQVIHRPH